jgi:hypothetical protein
MTTAVIITTSVITYLIAGIATAVLAILNWGEPPADMQWMLLFVVLIWPIVLAIELPIFVARLIEARRAARREKPEVFTEYDEENR